MTVRLEDKRLAQLRTAAEVGIRMAGLQPHTVHVIPDELAALVEEVLVSRAHGTTKQEGFVGVACRKCGCTDTDCSGCIERTGAPCSWVERDLCSACSDQPQLLPADSLARGLCIRHSLPGAMVIALDVLGALHTGCAAIDHPVTADFVEMAKSLNLAMGRGVPGFSGLTREQAIKIASRCRAKKPLEQSSIEIGGGQHFLLMEWVVDAILQAASTLPAVSAKCSHCGHEIGSTDNVDAIRAHSMTCKKSPVVELLAQAREALRKVPIVRVADTGYTCIGCGSKSGLDATTGEAVDEPCKPDCWVAKVETALAEMSEEAS